MYFLLKFWSGKVALHVTINVRELSLTNFFGPLRGGGGSRLLCFLDLYNYNKWISKCNTVELADQLGGRGRPLAEKFGPFSPAAFLVNENSHQKSHCSFLGCCGSLFKVMHCSFSLKMSFKSVFLVYQKRLPSELPALEMPFGGQIWGGQFWVCLSSELPALSILFVLCWYSLQIVLCVV